MLSAAADQHLLAKYFHAHQETLKQFQGDGIAAQSSERTRVRRNLNSMKNKCLAQNVSTLFLSLAPVCNTLRRIENLADRFFKLLFKKISESVVVFQKPCRMMYAYYINVFFIKPVYNPVLFKKNFFVNGVR